MLDLRPLLYPCSVAIVGASADPAKIGYRPLRFLLDQGFQGRIFPVNPNSPSVQGLKAYPSLTALPEVPELAVIIVSAARVPEVLTEAGRLGVRAVLVISSGFAEVGPKGRALQEQVAAIARQYNIALCGPNTVGIINGVNGLAATFSEALIRSETVPGNVGFVSQSGAFGTVIFALARERGIGLRTYVNSGNEACLEMADYIRYLAQDPEVRVIGGYIEGIRDGQRFLAAAREADKPLVMVKVGRSERGRRAAASHTGSIAGQDSVYDAAFRQAGVLRARDESELLDWVDAFQVARVLPGGPRVAIVSMSGGAGVLLSDQLSEHGLLVPELAAGTVEQLQRILPPFASAINPVDLTGQFVSNASGLTECLRAIAADPGIDAVLAFVGLGWQASEAWVQGILDVATAGEKALVVIWPLGPAEAIGSLRRGGVPVFSSPGRAVSALAAMARYAVHARCRSEAAPAPAPAPDVPPLPATGGALAEHAAKALLSTYGVSVARGGLATNPDAAVRIAAELGGPLVLKAQAAALQHKTEAGAVRLGVRGEAAVREAFAAVQTAALHHQPGIRLDGVLVEEMVSDAVEVIVGVTRAPPFGQMLMFGLGGIFVEVMRDVTFRLVPLTLAEAQAMIREVRGFGLLAGARGRPPADLDALAAALVSISRLAHDLGDRLDELDVNPLMVLPAGRGVRVADALLVLRSPS